MPAHTALMASGEAMPRWAVALARATLADALASPAMAGHALVWAPSG